MSEISGLDPDEVGQKKVKSKEIDSSVIDQYGHYKGETRHHGLRGALGRIYSVGSYMKNGIKGGWWRNSTGMQSAEDANVKQKLEDLRKQLDAAKEQK